MTDTWDEDQETTPLAPRPVVLEDCTLKLPDGDRRTFRHRTIRIGSHSDNDVVLAGQAVSRFHAEIVRGDDGLAVRDLESTNGTFVNNVRVVHAYLANASVLTLGDVSIGIELKRQVVTSELSGQDRLGDLVGHSPAMRRLFHLIQQVAPTDATLLVLGETGTGKEVVARTVHAMSRRAQASLVVVDCGAIPENLLESTLFGHERGAFTGATVSHIGLFEQADRGTVFIDEVAELPLELQTRLLRVIESREIRRVGGTRPVRLDLRFIAATNRELAERVREGRFREDLYHRLNAIPLRVPPLRNRREDIPLLVRHLLATATWNDDGKGGRRLAELPPQVMERLVQHHYPGNVRELVNLVCRAATLPDLDVFSLDLCPPAAGRQSGPVQRVAPFKEAKEELLRSFEVDYLTTVLSLANGSVSKAAVIAGLGRQYFRDLLRKAGIPTDDRHDPGNEETVE